VQWLRVLRSALQQVQFNMCTNASWIEVAGSPPDRAPPCCMPNRLLPNQVDMLLLLPATTRLQRVVHSAREATLRFQLHAFSKPMELLLASRQPEGGEACRERSLKLPRDEAS
jgi:hypothetical protein